MKKDCFEDFEVPMVTVEVTDIDYDVDENDAEENDMSISDIIDSLPKSLTVRVEHTGDWSDLEDAILCEIETETGFCVNDFCYNIIKK